MCGIAGGWWSRPPEDLNDRIACSLSKLRLRGPNDQGCEYFDSHGGKVALGHTRLSIIDLTAAAHQPMRSQDARYSLIFNGEIYNYRELRQELTALGRHFISDSDTEVLLAAWQQWHSACLVRLEGMFAFAIYDARTQTLSCVRDAFGIKPFYYDTGKDRFLFGSEQAALLCLREEAPRANWQRCYDYLVYGDFDNSQQTFIEGIEHLLPGHWMEIDLAHPDVCVQQCWWSPDVRQSSTLSFEQAAEAVREQFLYNVKLHLRSDVPLGAALSGGIDSSAIVCAMRHLEPDLPITTFSYIAPGDRRSEEVWADRINEYVGATSHKVAATQDELARDLESLIQAQGEPFTSTSVYAQYRVFQLARDKGITVTLEGQGADELLAGYAGYPGQRLLSLIERGDLLGAQRFALNWSRWPGRSYGRAWQYLAAAALPDYLFGAASRITGRSFTPSWLKLDVLADAGVNMVFQREKKHAGGRGRRVVERLISSLNNRHLPGYLREGDRNSMRFSIESRVPFLTVPLANLLFSMPEHYLISHGGETKSVFRAAMRGIMPDQILDRRDKIGFETPEQTWLMAMAGTVRTWLQASEAVPFLDHKVMLEQFDAITSGKTPCTLQVWRWVNFVKWYEQAGLR
jgi:asparagine synthase (glutamine-hydrolysing)